MTNEEFARKYANKVLKHSSPSMSYRIQLLKVVGYFIGNGQQSIHLPTNGIIVEYDTSGYSYGALITMGSSTSAIFTAPGNPLKGYWVVEQKYFVLPDDEVITKPMGVPVITDNKKISHYPHVCPRKDCGKPAYVSIYGGKVDCSSRICNHYS